jgi:SAM-dependent methyltransferase
MIGYVPFDPSGGGNSVNSMAEPFAVLAPDVISGDALYGDDFDAKSISKWFEAEEHDYYDMSHEDYAYGYHPLNWHYFYKDLADRRFERSLSLGCARGDEILPIADQIDEIVAVEPAKAWWSDRIGKTRARYVMPRPDGKIDLPNASVDLITCFGVLHHIPNVSKVLRELGRVAKPNAIFVLREPSHAMGDFRVPRPGLTRNERGIAPKWLLKHATAAGWQVERAVHHDFGALTHFMNLFGVNKNQSPFLIRLDRFLAVLTQWNHRYWRTAPWQKMAPSTMSYRFRRRTD